MPLNLKEDITTICEKFYTNPSDLMRKPIVQFVENIKQNPDQNSRYMFVWYVRNHISLILWGWSVVYTTYPTDIPSKKTPFVSLMRSFYIQIKRFGKRCWRCSSSGSKSAILRSLIWQTGIPYGDTHSIYPPQSLSARLTLWETWPHPSAWRLPCFLIAM